MTFPIVAPVDGYLRAKLEPDQYAQLLDDIRKIVIEELIRVVVGTPSEPEQDSGEVEGLVP